MRSWSFAACTAVVLSLCLAAVGASGDSGRPRRGRLLRGTQAIQSLGPRLSQAALRRGIAPARLRQLLAWDAEAAVDSGGEILYTCRAAQPALAAAPQAAPPATPPLPPDSTFRLHSRPGAERTIYLDFDGHTTTGTLWNGLVGMSSIVSAPFTKDGIADQFSAGELEWIQRIWMRVAEDFAPFEIDVTTEDPGLERLRRTSVQDSEYGVRVVISPTWEWYPTAGGVAYLGAFNAVQTGPDLPCFVFSGLVFDEAATVSHEAGHTLGLEHDGFNEHVYYMGRADWAPIMGSSPGPTTVSHWSRGEYTGANNLQDDVAIIAARGGPQRADDHGDMPGSASAAAPTLEGLIATREDVDFFRVDMEADTLSVTADPAPDGANLDIRLNLYDARGSLLLSQDPQVPYEPLGASFSVDLPRGTYYLSVEGTGRGDAFTDGYSDYGSLGAYTLKTKIGPIPRLKLLQPSGGEWWVNGSRQTLTWSSHAVPGPVRLEYSTDGGTTWETIAAETPNDGSEEWTIPGGIIRARIRVTAVDGSVSDTSDGDVFLIDTFEPDDSVAKAGLITAGETQARSLHLGSDEDWVYFTLPERSAVQLKTGGPIYFGDTHLELYGPDNPSLKLDSSHSELDRTGSRSLAPGTYYVRVHAGPAKWPLKTYTLSLTVSAAPRITVTSPNGGESWPHSTPITITWSSKGVTGRVQIQQSWDGGKNWYGIGPLTANDGHEAWSLPAYWPAQGLIRVSSFDDPQLQDTSDAPFAITGPQEDLYEKDGTRKDAKTLIWGETQWHSFHKPGDVDWVKITLTEPRKVYVRTYGPAGGDTVLELFNSRGARIGQNNDATRSDRYSLIRTKTLKRGVYYLKICERRKTKTLHPYYVYFEYLRG